MRPWSFAPIPAYCVAFSFAARTIPTRTIIIIPDRTSEADDLQMSDLCASGPTKVRHGADTGGCDRCRTRPVGSDLGEWWAGSIRRRDGAEAKTCHQLPAAIDLLECDDVMRSASFRAAQCIDRRPAEEFLARRYASSAGDAEVRIVIAPQSACLSLICTLDLGRTWNRRRGLSEPRQAERARQNTAPGKHHGGAAGNSRH